MFYRSSSRWFRPASAAQAGICLGTVIRCAMKVPDDPWYALVVVWFSVLGYIGLDQWLSGTTRVIDKIVEFVMRRGGKP